MKEPQNSPKSLSEAIALLESSVQPKAQDLKANFEKEYETLKAAMESLKPHLEDLKSRIGDEASKTKQKVETEVSQHPWISLGIVGLIGLIIGLLLGRKRD